MQSPVTFERPWLLLLLPLALAAFWGIGRRSYAGLNPGTAQLALIVRSLLATLLVCALAGIHLVQRSDKLATIFLLDVSKSVRNDQQAAGREYINKALGAKRAGDQGGVIEFGRTANTDEAPSETMQSLEQGKPTVAGDATNLSEALRLAKSSFPSGLGRKIVVLSDGNENVGEAETEIDSLRADGVRVDVAPTALGQGANGVPVGEAMVDDVSLPTRARQDQPFNVRVVVSSTVAQTGTLTLTRDGQPLGAQSVPLKAGKNAFTYSETVHGAGFHKYDAVLSAPNDTIAENNHGFGFVAVQGRPRILYIADAASPGIAGIKNALAAQQIDMDVQTPGAIPANVAALASYDAVVLSDVPADELGPGQMSALEAATKEFGVGLGMVGGPNSFAAGSYTGTPIETALPVKMDIKDKKRFPTVAVALVIEDLEEPGNVNMSIEAAKAVVDLLDPQDQIGVEDCNGTWRIPMQPVTDKNKIKGQMASLTDMNDPPTYDPYILEAGRVLGNTQAQVKHIIFLGDGDAINESGQNTANLQNLKKQGITLSTIATGADAQGAQFLASLSSIGGGSAYVAEKPEDLPRLLLKDQQSVSKLRIIEEPFLAKPIPDDEVIAGIDWGSQPPLLGYNVSSAKPGAVVALTAPDHRDPVFAYWRYGLGRTFAFTSDDRPHWAVHWLGWPGYARFWAQTLRWSLRQNTNADFQSTLDNQNGKGHLVVDAFTSAGGFANGTKVVANVVGPDLSLKPVMLSQTGPGRYEGVFDADQTGPYLVNVHQGEAASTLNGSGPAPPSQTVSLVVPYSPEYRTLGPNLPLLTRLTEGTGGKVQNDAAQIYRDAPSWVVGVRDIGPLLLLWAALLFLADVAIRRLVIRPALVRETVTSGVQTAGSRVAAYRDANARPAAQPSTPQMNRLLERKTTARTATTEDEATTTQQLLNRRASRAQEPGDDPFPYVASLPPKPKAAPKPGGADKLEDEGYTNRLLEAKRRAKDKDA
jgi:Ca-activated chloride channel family protein